MPDSATFTMNGQVPGCSISDLIRAGKLPEDLFWRDNADAVQVFERCTYEYTRDFDCAAEPGRRYVLRFERLDTYCTV